MSFTLRIEGFGKIEKIEVYPSNTVLEIKQLFCAKIGKTHVVPFVNSRRLLDAHTLEEAHVNADTIVKMYDVEMAELILKENESIQPRLRFESVVSPMNMLSIRPMARLQPWNPDGKSKNLLGLF